MEEKKLKDEELEKITGAGGGTFSSDPDSYVDADDENNKKYSSLGKDLY